MAVKTYSGYSDGLNLTSVRNVPLTGSGTPVGVVSGAVAYVRLSTTNASQLSGKTIYVTVISNGVSYYGSYYITSSSDWAGEYSGHVFAITISGAGSGFALNNVTAMEISVSASGSYIFTKGTQSVNVTYQGPTVNGAPTSCYVDATALNPSATTTLRFPGATAGVAGGISGYEVQQADSSDSGATWGSWSAVGTPTATTQTVSANSTSGCIRKFRVRALSSLDAAYHSDWKESTNAITTNYPTKLSTPASANFKSSTANPGVSVDFEFAGVSGVNLNALESYEIQTRSKPVDGVWTDWGSSSSVTASPKAIAANNTHGTEIHARVRAKGSAGETYYSNWRESSNTLKTNYPTAITPPTVFSINKTLADPSEVITLSWSGTVAGNLNTITVYDIDYRESVDGGSTWGIWKDLTTVNSTDTFGSYETTAASAYGTIRQYRISVRGSAGVSYYSTFKDSSNTVLTRTPTKIQAPTSIQLDTQLANPGVATMLRFSGAQAGTINAITKYEVQRSDSSNLEAWSSWTSAGTLDTSETSGAIEVTAPTTNGDYRRFRIRVQGSAGTAYYSDWVDSPHMLQATPITKTKAPAQAYVTPTNTETTAQIFFSGADDGVYNLISGYGYQYAESEDGVTYGSWSSEQNIAITEKSGDFTVNPPSSRGSFRKFRIRTKGAAGASFYSDWFELSTTLQKNTVPIAPTTLTFEANPFLNTAVLKWSGDLAGVGNNVASYTLGYALSDNGSSFASEVVVTGVTGRQHSIDLTAQPEGKYIRFRVMVIGTGGLSSAWSGYSETGRKNTTPTAPSGITVPQVIDPSNGVFTVSFTDGVDPDNNIVGYEAAMKYPDGTFYGEPTIVAKSTEGTVGYIGINATTWQRDTYWYIAVRTYDALGLKSEWAVSEGMVQINPLQAIPTIMFPTTNRATYSTRPRVGIKVQQGAPSRQFSLKLNFNNVERSTVGDLSTEFSKTGNAIQNNTQVLWRLNTALSYLPVVIKDVRTNDGVADLPAGSRPSQRTIVITQLSLTDSLLTPNLTQVKAAHINELRNAINTMETYYGLSLTAWSEPIVKDVTNIKSGHITELRLAVDRIIQYVNLFDPDNATNNINPVTWTDPSLLGVVIKAQHVQEIRNAVLSL